MKPKQQTPKQENLDAPLWAFVAAVLLVVVPILLAIYVLEGRAGLN